MTCAAILILPSCDAPKPAPRTDARLRSPVTASSRPMMTATIQAGARSSCTSEMNAADVSSLSASGSIIRPSDGHLPAAARQIAVEPVGERGQAEDRRATSAVGTPKISMPFELRQQDDDEQRDQEDARDGQRVGQVHLAAQPHCSRPIRAHRVVAGRDRGLPRDRSRCLSMGYDRRLS